ncbi:MAG: 8-oxo-dGTP diphosphatase [bacterium]|nr:8-oxo-dGTP diphosphatase [bacterium]
MKKLFTLCIVHQGNQVLLGMKKRGFGEGRWNGFGGKVKEGESIEEAMERELLEEAGISPVSFAKRGIMEFRFAEDPVVLEVHAFHVPAFVGEPQETEEMMPQWYAVGDIPFEKMWQDDKFWLPLFLEGKTLRGRFSFSNDDTLLDYALDEVESLEQ